MNYKKEAKNILQEYMSKFHIIFKDPKEAEDLVLIGFMKGYDKGLDFAIKQKPIK